MKMTKRRSRLTAFSSKLRAALFLGVLVASLLGIGVACVAQMGSEGNPPGTAFSQASAGAIAPRAENAKSAYAFVDSIGVATHLRYLDTTYGRYGNLVEPRLRELGIRHIRDGGNNSDFFAKLNRLARFGIRSTLVFDPRDKLTPDNAVSVLKKVLPSVVAIEGPNEWDIHNLTYKGKGFPAGVRTYQTELYQAVKRDPTTAKIAVLTPSIAHPENAAKVGSLKGVSDYGNLHIYAGGGVPALDFESKWIPLTRKMTSDRTLIVTETGWHNAVNDRNAGQKGVPEQVSAKYIPRVFLEYFNRGIKRTFLYELLDERSRGDQESNFGIIRANGVPKPAFIALQNLIRVLNDPPNSAASGSLSYTLSGNVSNIHRTLLQKRNGDFYLVLWLHTESNERLKTQRVTLNLGTPTQLAETYFPNRSSAVMAKYRSPRQITLDVPDAPLIVRIAPKR
ncbi:hypothetical protein [Myxacorys almedinensis]|uniref:Uncharacterized protein n=1 Tax=Myxacorys almedinensis A TaxID=2690445 RepID=A0A8J7Z3X4_9CYAN|nr:hypothetical protein [Myxacorys almedinensis]NDJ16018.1 hypothetical protein [Myxacorys almedinensis A]